MKQKGQGLVEYALILVLVAVIVTAVLLILGPVQSNPFTGTVVSQTIVCPVQDVQFDSQPTSCTSRILDVTVNFNDVQTVLWTNDLSANFQAGKIYSFSFDLNTGRITNYSAAK